MKLSDAKWDGLRYGMKVIGASGRPGKITKLNTRESGTCHPPDRWISIDFDRGETSWQEHQDLERVTIENPQQYISRRLGDLWEELNHLSKQEMSEETAESLAKASLLVSEASFTLVGEIPGEDPFHDRHAND